MSENTVRCQAGHNANSDTALEHCPQCKLKKTQNCREVIALGKAVKYITRKAQNE